MNQSIPRNILLIDDEEEFRSVISKSLIKNGFDVLEAADGKEGVRKAIESRPDLIVCDLSMSEMNGYEVLAALRREERLADIPVIFLTAQSEPAEVRQGMSLGADDYLIKPANFQDLLGAINVRLDRRQSQLQRQEKQMGRAMQLFAEAVHDLRNPLFAIFAYTDQLKNAAGELAPSHERAEQLLAGMQQAATRMQDIISETMYVVRSRTRRPGLNRSVFDLRQFCELLLTDHEPYGKAPEASPVDSRPTGSFLIKTLTERRLVKISEIKSIIAYGEYSWVYWDKSTNGALLRKSLKRWKSELPEEHFIRVHRRAIVNLTFLDRVERLPTGRLQIRLREMPDPILVSLRQTPAVNRKLKALRVDKHERTLQ